MGLNLLTGYNGQVSIGHGAFFGFGMFTTAILMESHNWPFVATVPVAAALSFGVGVLVGFPALRVKGLYLALVTLGLAVLFPQLTNRFVPHDLCKTCGTSQVGELARTKLRPPSWAPHFIGANDQWAYYAALAVAVVGLVVARAAGAQPVRPGSDRRSRPRGRRRDGRHQHRVGQGDRIRDERAVRRRCRFVFRARQAPGDRVVGVDLPALDRVPRRRCDRGYRDGARSVRRRGHRRLQRPVHQRVVPEHAAVLAHQRFREEPPLTCDLRYRADPAHVRAARRHCRRRAPRAV